MIFHTWFCFAAFGGLAAAGLIVLLICRMSGLVDALIEVQRASGDEPMD